MKTIQSASKIIAAFFILGLLFFSCSLGDTDNSGTLVLILPGSNSSRAAVSPEFTATLSYRVDCSGPGRVTRDFRPGDPVSLSLIAGNWNATVTVLNAAGQDIGSGTESFTIKSGQTTPVEMRIKIDANRNDITYFAITSPVFAKGVISEDRVINIDIPFGKDISKMTYQLIHTGVRIDPPEGSSLGGPLDFISPKNFRVYAENTEIEPKDYIVEVTYTYPSGYTMDWPEPETWAKFGLMGPITPPQGDILFTWYMGNAMQIFMEGLTASPLTILKGEIEYALFGAFTGTIEEAAGWGETYTLEYDYEGYNYSLSIVYGNPMYGFGTLYFYIVSDKVFEWPANSTWANYGLSGLSQPAGSSVNKVEEITVTMSSTLIVDLENINAAHYSSLYNEIRKTFSLYHESEESGGSIRMAEFQKTSAGNSFFVILSLDLIYGTMTIIAERMMPY